MKTSFQRILGFTRMQRLGILSLASLVVSIQLFILFADFTPGTETRKDAAWLAVQHQIDSLKIAQANRKPKIYPFNPNFITDYKGYRLGMSVAEIDRLLAFREKGLFVNSADEFQNVTGVSDSLLSVISPYFKFPAWVKNRKAAFRSDWKKTAEKTVAKIDINLATKEQLMAIYGIGDALSDRILKQREALGGFVDISQMDMVWGLSPEVVGNLKRRFDVKQVPAVKKINVNEASVKELAAFPYFRYALAKNIVTQRSMNGKITNSEDLVKIGIFTVENEKIIRLYLEF